MAVSASHLVSAAAAVRRRPMLCALAVRGALLALGGALAGCSSFAPTKLAEATLDPVTVATEPLDLSHVVPSNVRQWEPDQTALASARFDGDRVTVRNIRHNAYVT